MQPNEDPSPSAPSPAWDGFQGSNESSTNVVTAPAIPHLRVVRYAHDVVSVDEPFSFPVCFKKVLAKLGAGSYGIVYLVEMDDPRPPSADRRPTTRFAAKYIPLRKMDSRSMLRVVREIEMLTVFHFSLEVVETVRVFVDANRRTQPAVPNNGCSDASRCRNAHAEDSAPALWIVMELFDHSLYDYYPPFRRGIMLPLVGFRNVMAQVLLGLSLIHEELCCHRDLSPRNILVSRDQHAALADFGLARFLNEDHSYTTDGVVTILYRAPEVALGVKNYTTKVDMWSVGVLLAEFLLQCHLFSLAWNDDKCLLYEIFEKVGVPSPDDMAGPYSTVSFLAAAYMDECQEELRLSPRPEPFDLPQKLRSAAAFHFQGDPVAHSAIDLCLALLQLNPETRLSAATALEHDFFDGQREFINREKQFNSERLEVARDGRPPGHLFTTSGGTLEELYHRLLEFAPLV